ncbi:uncharacterized protein LOC124357582 [Homalodisca vitripennis]|uniref:uncharacterized protein LOC124357582 n=1 Tax=Homalodisca vitripennis TaxID=197043 RepID=UPI001EEBAA4C|nr:uncharacterized protein LOC124357582 [Homalodisca vitripennis]
MYLVTHIFQICMLWGSCILISNLKVAEALPIISREEILHHIEIPDQHDPLRKFEKSERTDPLRQSITSHIFLHHIVRCRVPQSSYSYVPPINETMVVDVSHLPNPPTELPPPALLTLSKDT